MSMIWKAGVTAALLVTSSATMAATIVNPSGVTLATLSPGDNLANTSEAGIVYLFYEGTYDGVASYLLHYDRRLRDPASNTGSFEIQLGAGETFGGLLTTTADLDATDPANGVTYPHGTLSFRGLETSTVFADTATATTGNPVLVTFSLNTSVPARDEARFLVDVGSVPEPASWALMISGFGLVGGALRHRRTVSFAA